MANWVQNVKPFWTELDWTGLDQTECEPVPNKQNLLSRVKTLSSPRKYFDTKSDLSVLSALLTESLFL